MGQLQDILCICVGFSPTQRMIEVRNMKEKTKLRGKMKQEVGETERIGPTRDTDDDRIAGLQERMPVNVGGNTRNERIHVGIIARRERSTKGSRYFRRTFGHPASRCYN